MIKSSIIVNLSIFLFNIIGIITPLILLPLFLFYFTLKFKIIIFIIYLISLIIIYYLKQNFLHDFFIKHFDNYKYFYYNEVIFDNNDNINRNLLCFHPHGIIGVGFFFNGIMNKQFKYVKWLVSKLLLLFPGINILMKSCNVSNVSKKNMIKLMNNNETIAIIPGGFEEAALTEYNANNVYIKDRKGFIKLALQHGYNIRTVYTFGETHTYKTINIFNNFRLFLSKFKIPCIFFYGDLFVMPLNDNKLITVIGPEINIPLIKNPTQDDINKYHDIYIENLQYIFEKYKHTVKSNNKLTLF